MHVIATAGHVDHGKSTLVRALTGMEPDRWAEERRRGMTIDLGFAWTTLPSGAPVAFVDVPGHERFVANMLAGVGPVPVAMFVVAADEGWKPQSEEHLQVLDTLGVRHALLVVTKADLSDPAPALQQARERLDATSLRGASHVVVSAQTGVGLGDVVAALDRLVASLPRPAVDVPVRLWVDRSFTIRGAGTVVTGTLAAGVVRVGDTLTLAPSGATVAVRGLESCKQRCDVVSAVTRVAVNLRGVAATEVTRGMALVTPNAWRVTDEVDAILGSPLEAHGVVAHLGSAAVPARLRTLGGNAVRLRLATPLPLHVGDRVLLRDPARHVVLARADVADVAPVALVRRGDAALVATELALPVRADDVVRRRGAVTDTDLAQSGITESPQDAVRIGRWWVARSRWAVWRDALPDVVARAADPLSPGVPLDAVQRALGLPDGAVAAALADDVDDVRLEAGRVRPVRVATPATPALDILLKRLADDPFDAPEAAEITTAGLDRATLAHGARAGLLLHLGNGVYVAPGAPAAAVARLARLDQPFTVSAARQALGSTRRVVVPLLEHLDATRRTRRLPDGTRLVVAREG